MSRSIYDNMTLLTSVFNKLHEEDSMNCQILNYVHQYQDKFTKCIIDAIRALTASTARTI